MTLDDVKKWMEEASKDDLTEVADILIDRDFAVHPDDVEHESDGLFFEDEPDVDPAMLEDALSRLRRREYSEALHLLANALGRDFFDLERIPLIEA